MTGNAASDATRRPAWRSRSRPVRRFASSRARASKISEPPRRREILLSAILFLGTAFTTTTLGAAWFLYTRTDVVTDLLPWLGPDTVRRVWTEPEVLAGGLAFSIPTLLILLTHELGHYWTCRRYGLPATPPMFLPVPFGLGTLGAFIKIRSPIRGRRQLFDIGASGPLAGFAALLPFLVVGMARSRPTEIERVPETAAGALLLIVPGRSLGTTALARVFHGPLAPDQVLDLHPFALAGWVGLLVTALNLIPLGQLDGGHVLYAVAGRAQRRWAPWLFAGLLALAWVWPGWLLWAAIIFFVMKLRHPPVWDPGTPLGTWRRLAALACLAIFLFCFMPVPAATITVAP